MRIRFSIVLAGRAVASWVRIPRTGAGKIGRTGVVIWSRKMEAESPVFNWKSEPGLTPRAPLRVRVYIFIFLLLCSRYRLSSDALIYAST